LKKYCGAKTFYNFSGVSGGDELWRYCISDTDSVLGFALGAMFVKEAFNGHSKDKVQCLYS